MVGEIEVFRQGSYVFFVQFRVRASERMVDVKNDDLDWGNFFAEFNQAVQEKDGVGASGNSAYDNIPFFQVFF